MATRVAGIAKEGRVPAVTVSVLGDNASGRFGLLVGAMSPQFGSLVRNLCSTPRSLLHAPISTRR